MDPRAAARRGAEILYRLFVRWGDRALLRPPIGLPHGRIERQGTMRKSWYALMGLMVLLIALLLGFAGYMTYEASRRLCADGKPRCAMPGP